MMFAESLQPVRPLEDRAHYICCKKRADTSGREHDPICQTVTEERLTYQRCIICQRIETSPPTKRSICNCEYDYIKTLVRSPAALMNPSLERVHKVCCTEKPNGQHVPTLVFVSGPGHNIDHWECIICKCAQDNVTEGPYVICECEVARRDKLLRELRGPVAKL